jgi:ketosteroid isomerase-like protein
VGANQLAPDFEWVQFPEAVEPGERRGAGVSDALRNLFEVYRDFRFEASEFIDAGDKVVVTGCSRGIARGSGVDLDMEASMVWTLRGGKLVRNQAFTDRRKALEAAGLRE